MKTILLHNNIPHTLLEYTHDILVSPKHFEINDAVNFVLVHLSQKRWEEVQRQIGDKVFTDIDGKTYQVMKVS